MGHNRACNGITLPFTFYYQQEKTFLQPMEDDAICEISQYLQQINAKARDMKTKLRMSREEKPTRCH